MENAHGHFSEIERKYGSGEFTDVLVYMEAVNEMKRIIQAERTRSQLPFGGNPGNPSAGATSMMMERR